MAFSYPARVQGSNLEPIAIEIRRDGEYLDPTGVTVMVTVVDRPRKLLIVENAQATHKGEGRWEFYFTPEQVGDIVRNSIWQVQWTIKLGEYLWRSPEPALLPVRKALSLI